jgi:hypothetical protein
MPTSPRTATPTPAYTDIPDVPAALVAVVNHLEKVTVPKFLTATARDTAITAPVDGDMAYVTGTGLMIYHGGWLLASDDDTAQTSLTMVGTWSSAAAPTNVLATRRGGSVQLQGLANSSATATAATNQIIATLPAGYRPAASRVFPVHANAGPIGVNVATTGNIIISSLYGAAGVSFVYLDAINFRL